MRLEQHDIVTLDEAESVDSLTKKLGDLLVNQKLRLTTAESCTGGKLASALCAAEDTPSFYGVGYVTFTDEAKAKILRVQRHNFRIYLRNIRSKINCRISVRHCGYSGHLFYPLQMHVVGRF